MLSPKIRWVRRAVKRTLKRFSSRAAILMYHRVAPKGVDPWGLCVTPEHFAQQLEVIRRRGSPVRLRELAEALRTGRVPDRAVAVTLDDGYANNLYEAKPLLERYDTPATVFVTTAYLESAREFWWDELIRAVLEPARLPDALVLAIGGVTRRWELGPEPGNGGADRSPNSPRLAFYLALREALRPLSHGDRQAALDALLAWAGTAPAYRPTHRPLQRRELATLENGGLVDIGAHTATHPVLPAHPVEVQREEIRRSKVDLEAALGHPVEAFAYPFGEYSQQTIGLVRQAGFSWACGCNEPESVWWRSDGFELPRFKVEDWSGPQFERRLVQWLKS